MSAKVFSFCSTWWLWTFCCAVWSWPALCGCSPTNTYEAAKSTQILNGVIRSMCIWMHFFRHSFYCISFNCFSTMVRRCHKSTSSELTVLFLGIIAHDMFISRFLGNTIWLMALAYYVYITFLGYNCKYSAINTDITLIMMFCHRYSISEKYENHFGSADNHCSSVHHDFNHRMECGHYIHEFLPLSCSIEKRESV